MKRVWKLVVEVLPSWLAIASVATILSFLVYVAVQQNYRQSANDPQIQIAEDLSESLSKGMGIESLANIGSVDISQSLSPFFVVYDLEGKPLAGNAVLDAQTPSVPIGVLTNAKTKGENRITWQPKSGVRSAIVVRPFTASPSGYVMVGRSLREVEKRVDMLSFEVLLAWLGSLIVSLAILLKAKYLFQNTTYNSSHYKTK